ncbi:UNKNOWN [Stylonychia lemnae]|uniref:Uncharacterized protein n=1 Tax=Stylonychia lemnae TaxID=5949 RepID=A0A078AZN4_STYLE|nr:UNKNOWN [Stylonychia lemnae]|eukprot:CDW86662.1 UNKNOWN [Stylonychia lemnae]
MKGSISHQSMVVPSTQKLPPLYKKSVLNPDTNNRKSRNHQLNLPNETLQYSQGEPLYQTLPSAEIEYINKSRIEVPKKKTMLEQFKNYQNSYDVEEFSKSFCDADYRNSLSKLIHYNITPSNNSRMQQNLISAEGQLRQQMSQQKLGTSVQSPQNQLGISYTYCSPLGIKIDASDVLNFDYNIFYNEIKSKQAHSNYSQSPQRRQTDQLIQDNKQRHKQYIIQQLRRSSQQTPRSSSKVNINTYQQQYLRQSQNSTMGANKIASNDEAFMRLSKGNGIYITTTPKKRSQFLNKNLADLKNTDNDQIESPGLMKSDTITSQKLNQLASPKQKIMKILKHTLKPLHMSKPSETFNRTILKASELISSKVIRSSQNNFEDHKDASIISSRTRKKRLTNEHIKTLPSEQIAGSKNKIISVSNLMTSPEFGKNEKNAILTRTLSNNPRKNMVQKSNVELLHRNNSNDSNESSLQLQKKFTPAANLINNSVENRQSPTKLTLLQNKSPGPPEQTQVKYMLTKSILNNSNILSRINSKINAVKQLGQLTQQVGTPKKGILKASNQTQTTTSLNSVLNTQLNKTQAKPNLNDRIVISAFSSDEQNSKTPKNGGILGEALNEPKKITDEEVASQKSTISKGMQNIAFALLKVKQAKDEAQKRIAERKKIEEEEQKREARAQQRKLENKHKKSTEEIMITNEAEDDESLAIKRDIFSKHKMKGNQLQQVSSQQFLTANYNQAKKKKSNNLLQRANDIKPIELKTRNYKDFFEEDPIFKEETVKDKVRQRRNIKFMQILQQRREKFEHQQKHPIFGGFDPNKGKMSKKTYKIKMNIQKLDLNQPIRRSSIDNQSINLDQILSYQKASNKNNKTSEESQSQDQSAN